MTTATAWPEGVTARYLTVGGATVDLRPQPKNEAAHTYGDCTGCEHHIDWTLTEYARERAQSHAEKCRAMPRPSSGKAV
jgi:hypothetical protein